jgi:hypothetical protein
MMIIIISIIMKIVDLVVFETEQDDLFEDSEFELGIIVILSLKGILFSFIRVGLSCVCLLLSLHKRWHSFFSLFVFWFLLFLIEGGRRKEEYKTRQDATEKKGKKEMRRWVFSWRCEGAFLICTNVSERWDFSFILFHSWLAAEGATVVVIDEPVVNARLMKTVLTGKRTEILSLGKFLETNSTRRHRERDFAWGVFDGSNLASLLLWYPAVRKAHSLLQSEQAFIPFVSVVIVTQDKQNPSSAPTILIFRWFILKCPSWIRAKEEHQQGHWGVVVRVVGKSHTNSRRSVR